MTVRFGSAGPFGLLPRLVIFGGKTDEFLLFGLSVALGYVYPTINHCSLGVGCPANLVPATVRFVGLTF
jgi:hypothetical protein